MDRRNFLKFLGAASVGATVAYSFPSIIVPKNIIALEEVATDWLSEINRITREEIYPKVIRDFFFSETPLFSYLNKKHREGIIAHSLSEAVHIIDEQDKDKVIKVVSQIDDYYVELQKEINNRLL